MYSGDEDDESCLFRSDSLDCLDSKGCNYESKGILVAVRMRPLFYKERMEGSRSCCEINDEGATIKIRNPSVANPYVIMQSDRETEFAFDEVFSEDASQGHVYRKTTQPLISRVMEGFNVAVFAYGTTSAGKTHTMFGSITSNSSLQSTNSIGIIHRGAHDILAKVAEKNRVAPLGERWEVMMNYMEVYNEQVYDLLAERNVLALREDQSKGIVVVAGLIEKKVASMKDVDEFIARGNSNRVIDATEANKFSSRSHAVLQFTVRRIVANTSPKSSPTGKNSVWSVGRKLISRREAPVPQAELVLMEAKLSLIDLAGSEKASSISAGSQISANGARSKRMNEGSNINKSLLALANCINALAENSSGKQKQRKMNVKYRDSKLTLLLKNSLDGKSHLVLIANLNPSHLVYEDTLNTLKYANRAKNIKIVPTAVAIMDGFGGMSKEQAAIWSLRESHLVNENERLRARVSDLEELVMRMAEQISKMRGGSNVPIPENMATEMEAVKKEHIEREEYGDLEAPSIVPDDSKAKRKQSRVSFFGLGGVPVTTTKEDESSGQQRRRSILETISSIRRSFVAVLPVLNGTGTATGVGPVTPRHNGVEVEDEIPPPMSAAKLGIAERRTGTGATSPSLGALFDTVPTTPRGADGQKIIDVIPKPEYNHRQTGSYLWDGDDANKRPAYSRGSSVDTGSIKQMLEEDDDEGEEEEGNVTPRQNSVVEVVNRLPFRETSTSARRPSGASSNDCVVPTTLNVALRCRSDSEEIKEGQHHDAKHDAGERLSGSVHLVQSGGLSPQTPREMKNASDMDPTAFSGTGTGTGPGTGTDPIPPPTNKRRSIVQTITSIAHNLFSSQHSSAATAKTNVLSPSQRQSQLPRPRQGSSSPQTPPLKLGAPNPSNPSQKAALEQSRGSPDTLPTESYHSVKTPHSIGASSLSQSPRNQVDGDGNPTKKILSDSSVLVVSAGMTGPVVVEELFETADSDDKILDQDIRPRFPSARMQNLW